MTSGQAVVLISFVVLLLWIPLREQPGIGTVANALVVGVAADATLWRARRSPTALAARVALMVGGVVLNAAGHRASTSARSSAAARATG